MKEAPAPRPFCLFVKAYLPWQEADAFLAKIAAPWAAQAVETGGFESFFFIRYADPERHVRLRLFGSRAAILGAPRRKALEALERQAPAFSAKLVPSKYRPEWGRYGGRAGMRAAEKIFVASSRSILDFLQLREAGLETSKVEFALATGEMLLEALGMGREQRDAAFRPFARAGLPADDSGVVASFEKTLAPLLAKASLDPRGYWDESQAPLKALAGRFYAALDPVRAEWPALDAELTHSLPMLAQSYLHMHYNRLGLSQLQERLIRQFRGASIQARG